MTRIRRNWTPEEDAALRRAVNKALAQSRPLLWRELAKSVPGRTNKDCRRRWWNSLSAGTAKGPWSEEEDIRLIEAVRKYGFSWTNVAQAVMTRNADQCSSHWSQVLDPAINHCDWTTTEDAQLLHEVLTHGTNWATIATTHVPKRTTLGLKNRYSTLRLWNQNQSKKLQDQHMVRKSNEGETITVLSSPGRAQADTDQQEDEEYSDDDDNGDDDDEYDGDGTDSSGLSGSNEERRSLAPGPRHGNTTSDRELASASIPDSGTAAMAFKEILWDDRFAQPAAPTPVPPQVQPHTGKICNSMQTNTPCTTVTAATTATLNTSITTASRAWDPESTILSLAYSPPQQPLDFATAALPKDYARYHDILGSIPQASHPYPDAPLEMMDVDASSKPTCTATASRCSPSVAFCHLHHVHTSHGHHPTHSISAGGDVNLCSPPLTAATCTARSSSPDNLNDGDTTSAATGTLGNSSKKPGLQANDLNANKQTKSQSRPTSSTTTSTFYQVTLDIVCTLGQMEAVMTSLEREVGVPASIKILPKQ